MRAVLSTEVRVIRAALFAELAWLERRPELGLLCRAAEQAGHRISTATVQAALPGTSEAGAANVVAWCVSLGLCDRSGSLTELGSAVARSDEAPVPEQGVYGLWLAQHEALGTRALAAERLMSSRAVSFDDLRQPPYLPDTGRVFTSLADPTERFIVRGFPRSGGPVVAAPNATRARLQLSWTLDFDKQQDHLRLSGHIEAPGSDTTLHPIQHHPEPVGLDLWPLAEQWGLGPLGDHGHWDAETRRLQVPLAHLEVSARETFQQDLVLDEATVPGKGTYQSVQLQGVPIGPTDRREAQAWALDRLERRLRVQPGYRTRAQLFEDFAACVEGTPLEPHRPLLPAHTALEQSKPLRQQPAQYWSVVAPVDLAPRPVVPAELRARKLAGTAAEPEASAPGVVQVPFGSKVSMRRLVDRLLGGRPPAQVLLCDRYIRRPHQHTALSLLRDAVHATAPGVSIEVWTDDEDTDLAAIHALTGTSPRRYADVFGRRVPHDRYLLLRAVDGTRTAWQLSNSLLHPRATVAAPSIESSLEWRDLGAWQTPPDALPSPMNQWLTGGNR